MSKMFKPLYLNQKNNKDMKEYERNMKNNMKKINER